MYNTTTTTTAGFFTLWATKTSLRAAHGFILNSYQICHPVWAERRQQSRSSFHTWHLKSLVLLLLLSVGSWWKTPATAGAVVLWFLTCRQSHCWRPPFILCVLTFWVKTSVCPLSSIVSSSLSVTLVPAESEKYVRSVFFWMQDVHVLRNVARDRKFKKKKTPSGLKSKEKPWSSLFCQSSVKLS